MPAPASPLLLLAPTLLLAGCGGLAGRWQGELLCLGRAEIFDGDAVLALVSDRGGEFDGELRVEGEYQSATLSGAMVLSWEVELEKTRAAGSQELLAALDGCAVYVDGHLQVEDCPEDGLIWTWDGGDLLQAQGTNCELAVQRGGL